MSLCQGSRRVGMNRIAGIILVLVVIATLQFVPVRGGEAVDQTGEIGAAPYRIRIPAGWNGNLVMYAHGYKPRGGAWSPLADVLADVFLSRGFALAESGYSRQGWALEEAIAETEELRIHFSELHGEPDSTFVTGHSMGGLITLATIETFSGSYDGALPMCGPLAPALLFFKDHVFDMLVTFEALFSEHLPADFGPVVEAAALSGAVVEDALAADSMLAVTYAANRGVRREELAGIIAMDHMLYRELVDRAGGNPIDNRNTVYADFIKTVDLNAAVSRYAADPEALDYLRRNYTPNGRPGRPVLAVHTTYDAGVPPCVPGFYNTASCLLDDGKYFVQMYAEADGHCRFTPVMTGKAFDLLRGWAGTGVRPEPGRLE
jgi:pimeloyl-ACP methyl ester carboxylesterase